MAKARTIHQIDDTLDLTVFAFMLVNKVGDISFSQLPPLTSCAKFTSWLYKM